MSFHVSENYKLTCPIGQVKISMEIFYDNNLKLKNNLSVYNYANQNLET